MKLLGIGNETSSFSPLLISEGSLHFPEGAQVLSVAQAFEKALPWEEPWLRRAFTTYFYEVWKHFKGERQDTHWHTYLIFVINLLKSERKKIFFNALRFIISLCLKSIVSFYLHFLFRGRFMKQNRCNGNILATYSIIDTYVYLDFKKLAWRFTRFNTQCFSSFNFKRISLYTELKAFPFYIKMKLMSQLSLRFLLSKYHHLSVHKTELCNTNDGTDLWVNPISCALCCLSAIWLFKKGNILSLD